MSGNRTRLEAKQFWEQVQERNCAKPVSRRIPEGAKCGNCEHFVGLRCAPKHKPVNWYNVCENWQEETK